MSCITAWGGGAGGHGRARLTCCKITKYIQVFDMSELQNIMSYTYFYIL